MATPRFRLCARAGLPDFEKMQDPAPLDRDDPLARWRDEFHLPPGQLYFDGNSLGLLSRRAEAAVQRVMTEWATLGINGWTEGHPPWMSLAETISTQLAPLIGAAADEIALTAQTTVNLHQLLATLYDPTAARRTILADPLNFASDRYALHSHLRQRGLDPDTHLKLVPSADGLTLREADIIAAMTDDVQLVLLPAVLFVSGQLLDVATLTREARARGILIGFDCSHSIGAVPHAFDRDGVDFACWCHYKYLNAGPGAVGGLFLNRQHFNRTPGLAGWWGVRPDRRFAMAPAHEPADGAPSLHIGTPQILSLAPLQGSLEIIAEAGGIAALRAKSLALTRCLTEGLRTELADFGFTFATPGEDHTRGGHIALAHPEAWRICQALKQAGVIPDFRSPNIVRLAPSPLYTRFADCAEVVLRLREIMRSSSYAAFPSQPSLIP